MGIPIIQSSTWAMWFCDVAITPLARAWPAELGWCKTWTLDSGLDSWTGLWTEIWTGFWTDTQFNDDHFQHSVALNGLGLVYRARPFQALILGAGGRV